MNTKTDEKNPVSPPEPPYDPKRFKYVNPDTYPLDHQSNLETKNQLPPGCLLHSNTDDQSDLDIRLAKWKRDEKTHPTTFFSVQTLDLAKRAEAIQKVFRQVNVTKRLEHETLFYTVSYMDRFLLRVPTFHQTLQSVPQVWRCLWITCYRLAAKLNEAYPDIELPDSMTSVIKGLEIRVLDALEFRLYQPTALQWAYNYLEKMDMTGVNRPVWMRQIEFLLQLLLPTEEPMLHVPSKLAAAAIYRVLDYHKKEWSPAWQLLTGYTVRDLLDVLFDFGRHQHNGFVFYYWGNPASISPPQPLSPPKLTMYDEKPKEDAAKNSSLVWTDVLRDIEQKSNIKTKGLEGVLKPATGTIVLFPKTVVFKPPVDRVFMDLTSP